MKKRTIPYVALAFMVFVGMGGLCLSIWNRQPATPPTMSVGIKELNIQDGDVSITWLVQNKSEQILTFDENQVAQIEWNGSQVFYPTEGVRMAPDEERIYTLSLTGVNIEPMNTVEITASSKEGTRGTIRKTVYMMTQNT